MLLLEQRLDQFHLCGNRTLFSGNWGWARLPWVTVIMCGELNGQPAPAPPPAACQEGRALQHTSSVSSVGSASISFSCCKPILKPVSKDYFSEYYVQRTWSASRSSFWRGVCDPGAVGAGGTPGGSVFAVRPCWAHQGWNWSRLFLNSFSTYIIRALRESLRSAEMTKGK